jgi:hypothetical protein
MRFYFTFELSWDTLAGILRDWNAMCSHQSHENLLDHLKCHSQPSLYICFHLARQEGRYFWRVVLCRMAYKKTKYKYHVPTMMYVSLSLLSWRGLYMTNNRCCCRIVLIRGRIHTRASSMRQQTKHVPGAAFIQGRHISLWFFIHKYLLRLFYFMTYIFYILFF